MRRKAGKCSWERFLNCKNGILDPQDTISRLPEGVMHNIISFLPSADKEQVRFLSRKWRRVYAQSQKKLSLTGRRLDEQQFARILVDDFPSAEFLILRKCSGMKELRLVSYKLKSVGLYYCGSLKHVDLTTPDLESFHFLGPRINPCRIELGVCKQLRIVHLVGVAMNNMMFGDCSTTFPVLQILTLSGCDMSSHINISSSSLEKLFLLRFKKSVDITIDAPNLLSFHYTGSTIVPFSNMNLPHLDTARIELDPGQYQKRDKLWFNRLIEMLQGLRHTEMLVFETSSDKDIIIPKQLRETLAPPLDGIDWIVAMTKNRPNNCVDLVDAMLWISPRVKNLVLDWHYWIELELVHGEFSRTLDNSCCFCTSHPSRCWRHSLIEFELNNPTNEYQKKLLSYIRENLQEVGRNAIQRF